MSGPTQKLPNHGPGLKKVRGIDFRIDLGVPTTGRSQQFNAAGR
jgi:hypothetical protein